MPSPANIGSEGRVARVIRDAARQYRNLLPHPTLRLMKKKGATIVLFG